MDLQLYLWRGQRQLILEKHDFYIEQLKVRVFSQLRDVAGEADRFLDAEYERLGSLPGDGNTGLDEIAEEALDRGQAFYGLLSDLRKQMLLGALAGLYHQWDKELRDFIEHEIRQDLDHAQATRVWSWDIKRVFDLLAAFAWDCRSCPFFPRIEACGLIVNVYKHGKGRSLDGLASRFPEYLDDGFTQPPEVTNFVDHEWLSLSEEQLGEIGGALRSFWEAYPERLYFRGTGAELKAVLGKP